MSLLLYSFFIISKKGNPKTFGESKQIAVRGGTVAGNTRKDIEKQLGESIVTPKTQKITF